VRPALPRGATVRVVGGDAFLQLHVPRGHTAAILDYPTGVEGAAPPQYLRFLRDGTVEQNDESTAAVANANRYGHSSRTPHPDRAPRWRTVGHGGTFVWHDHRIHWMSTLAPGSLLRDRIVDMGGPRGTWTVPVVVDGQTHQVVGELRLLEAPSSVPWLVLIGVILAAAAVLAGLVLGSGRTWPYQVVSCWAIVVAATACVVGWDAWRSIPPAAGRNPFQFVVPVAALLGATVAGALQGRVRLAGFAASGAALIGWGWLRLPGLSHAVLPTSAPFVIDRLATAASLGTGLAIAVVILWHPPSITRSTVQRADERA
jgi:hypothetical protein